MLSLAKLPPFFLFSQMRLYIINLNDRHALWRPDGASIKMPAHTPHTQAHTQTQPPQQIVAYKRARLTLKSLTITHVHTYAQTGTQTDKEAGKEL